MEAGFWIDVGLGSGCGSGDAALRTEVGGRIASRTRIISISTATVAPAISIRASYRIKARPCEHDLIHGTGMSTSTGPSPRATPNSSTGKRKPRSKSASLDSIFKEYAPADVHFPKIDCEGANRRDRVLRFPQASALDHSRRIDASR